MIGEFFLVFIGSTVLGVAVAMLLSGVSFLVIMLSNIFDAT